MCAVSESTYVLRLGRSPDATALIAQNLTSFTEEHHYPSTEKYGNRREEKRGPMPVTLACRIETLAQGFRRTRGTVTHAALDLR